MTTNGSLLANRIEAVVAAGVEAINFSLDTFRKDRYQQITGRDRLDAVLDAMHGALSAPLRAVKINCVVMRGVNDDEIEDFVAFTREHPVSVRFIEYMPFGDAGWSWEKVVPYAEVLATVRAAYALTPMVPKRGETARRYAIPGHAGTVGFITPMTNHFCGSCNRLRLTSEGMLKNCLFHEGSVNLRNLMRDGATDTELVAAIKRAVLTKRAHMGGHETLDPVAVGHNAPMFQVGG